MTVLFMYNFRSLSNKFPKIFLSLIFRISLPKLSLMPIVLRKRKLTFSDSKMLWREEAFVFSKTFRNYKGVSIISRLKLP